MTKDQKSKKRTSKQSASNLSVGDYEKLGRTLESIFEGGYVDHHRVYKINFIRGIFFGLGTALGGTLVLASIAWIVTLFQELPLIGDFVEVIQASLNT